ncbi:hypothetical protein Q31a_04030 [Aureliella helgolandensis]|uniref:Uncharacterized protein n=1 Tax=Aureliella helgolandensis TaxID=2527968 RepID=A0A518G0Q8_9BACT|nr:hypothetical protein Q31a_04030 [Aureliella helgolandensis]
MKFIGAAAIAASDHFTLYAATHGLRIAFILDDVLDKAKMLALRQPICPPQATQQIGHSTDKPFVPQAAS